MTEKEQKSPVESESSGNKKESPAYAVGRVQERLDDAKKTFQEFVEEFREHKKRYRRDFTNLEFALVDFDKRKEQLRDLRDVSNLGREINMFLVDVSKLIHKIEDEVEGEEQGSATKEVGKDFGDATKQLKEDVKILEHTSGLVRTGEEEELLPEEKKTSEEVGDLIEPEVKENEDYYEKMDTMMRGGKSAAQSSPELSQDVSAPPVGVEAGAESRSGTVLQPPKKKSWLGRAGGWLKEKFTGVKEAVVKKEVGDIAAETAYKTVTSVLGVKTFTDIGRAFAGKGDIYDYVVGLGKTKADKKNIAAAYQDFSRAYYDLKKAKEWNSKKESLQELGKEVEKKLGNVTALIDSSEYIKGNEKKEMRLLVMKIFRGYKQSLGEADIERQKKVTETVGAYIANKVSGWTIAKDALNTAFTATGMSAMRGAMYGLTSMAERAARANREIKKQNVGKSEKERVNEFKGVLKDVFVNAAVETARAAVGMGEKKGATNVRRAADMVKAWGTIARGFGIYGLAASDFEAPAQAFDKFLDNVENNGLAPEVDKNFVQNAARMWEVYAHPVDTVERAYENVKQYSIPQTENGRMGSGLPSELMLQGAREAAAVAASETGAGGENVGDLFEQRYIDFFGEEALRKSGAELVALSAGRSEITGVGAAALLEDRLNAVMNEVNKLAVDNKGNFDTNGWDTMRSLVAEKMAHGMSPEAVHAELRQLVGSHEGLSHALARQFEDKLHDAYDSGGTVALKEYGFKGDINDETAVEKWAAREAGKLVRAEGWYGAGKDAWVTTPYATRVELSGEPGHWDAAITEGEENLQAIEQGGAETSTTAIETAPTGETVPAPSEAPVPAAEQLLSDKTPAEIGVEKSHAVDALLNERGGHWRDRVRPLLDYVRAAGPTKVNGILFFEDNGGLAYKFTAPNIDVRDSIDSFQKTLAMSDILEHARAGDIDAHRNEVRGALETLGVRNDLFADKITDGLSAEAAGPKEVAAASSAVEPSTEVGRHEITAGKYTLSVTGESAGEVSIIPDDKQLSTLTMSYRRDYASPFTRSVFGDPEAIATNAKPSLIKSALPGRLARLEIYSAALDSGKLNAAQVDSVKMTIKTYLYNMFAAPEKMVKKEYLEKIGWEN